MEDAIEILASVSSFLSSDIGLIVAIVAAMAAVWSAYSAARSAKHAQDVERRGLQRDVIGAAQSTVAEARRIDDLGAKLTLAYQTLFTFSGGSASSRLEMYVRDIDEMKHDAAVVKNEAESLTIDPKRMRGLSNEDLTSLLVRLDGNLTKVRIIKEKLEHDLSEVESQNAMYRSR